MVFFSAPRCDRKENPSGRGFTPSEKYAWHMADAQREGFEGASLEGFEQHAVMIPT